MNPNTLMLVLGGGAVLWWLSRGKDTAAILADFRLPKDAYPVLSKGTCAQVAPTSTGLPQDAQFFYSPTTKMFYCGPKNYPVAAILPPAGATEPPTTDWSKPVPTPQPGNVTTQTPAQTPAPPSPTFSQIVGLMVSRVTDDPSLRDAQGNLAATFSQFNWYLAQVSGLKDLPDYWTATNGQTDPNTPISMAEYVRIMEPWLKQQRGLSGFVPTLPSQAAALQHWQRPLEPTGPRRPWPGYVGPGGWRA